MGESAALRLVQVQLARAQGGRARVPVGVEESEFDLLPQHPAHRPVDQVRVHQPLLHGVDERVAEAPLLGQFDVHPGPQGECARVGQIGRHPVGVHQERQGPVVGDDGALGYERLSYTATEHSMAHCSRPAGRDGEG